MTRRLWVFAVVAVLLLAWIGCNLQREQNQRAERQREAAQQAAAYLNCVAHAKYPSLCMAP